MRHLKSFARSFCQTLALILFCFVLAPHAAAAEPPTVIAELPDTTVVPPPAVNGQEPIHIRVGLYILNLVALDKVQQTFTLTAYLTESWNDPRLAFSPKAGEPATHFYRKEDIWFPMIQFDNSATAPTVIGCVMSAKPDGTVHRIEKVNVTLSTSMLLRAFPFDAQNLEVFVHPFTGQVSRIVLDADPETTGLSDAPYAALPLWDTSQVTYRSVSGVVEKGYAVRSHIVFGLHVVRHAEYYIFRIFVPLFLMVAVSWGVLWIPPNDLNSQLMISVTTVLTLVAFSVAISNVLPPVPYLTFYDAFFLASFLFILLSIAEALAIHSMHGSRSHARAMRLRSTTRLLLPTSFVLAILVTAFIFLR
ncbi:MAG: hypothetical protein ACLQAT_09235 [Candidatus Binataceae bacterium]